MLAIDSIIFDVDGTLVDSRSDIAAAANVALKEMGYEEKPREVIAAHMGGTPEEFMGKNLETTDDELIARGVTIFVNYFVTHPAEAVKVYPHVREVLEYYRNKRNYLLTNRNREMTEATLKKLGFMNYFVDCVGARSGCSKPSTCPLDSLAERYNIDKERTILVGDMAVDIETGKRFGIYTCWVSYGLGKRDEVETIPPDYRIDDLAELKKIVK